MSSDRIFGAVMIVVALGYILSATTIEVPLFPDPMGPKMFPMLVAAGVILCSVVMIVRPDDEPNWPVSRAVIAIAVAALVMVDYAYSLKPLGFLIPTAIASGILSNQLSPRAGPAAITGLGLSVGLYVLFKYALKLETLRAFPKEWFA